MIYVTYFCSQGHWGEEIDRSAKSMDATLGVAVTETHTFCLLLFISRGQTKSHDHEQLLNVIHFVMFLEMCLVKTTR